MNGKGCHDSDASILKSDSPFAWQQHSLLAPSPLKTAACLFLPVDAMSEEKDFIPRLSPTWRKLSSVCHTDTGPVTVLYGELDTTIPALCCLRSAAELPHLGQRCILIITILLRPFCLTQLFLNGWRLTAWLSFLESCCAQKSLWLQCKFFGIVSAKPRNLCLPHLFFIWKQSEANESNRCAIIY